MITEFNKAYQAAVIYAPGDRVQLPATRRQATLLRFRLWRWHFVLGIGRL